MKLTIVLLVCLVSSIAVHQKAKIVKARQAVEEIEAALENIEGG